MKIKNIISICLVFLILLIFVSGCTTSAQDNSLDDATTTGLISSDTSEPQLETSSTVEDVSSKNTSNTTNENSGDTTKIILNDFETTVSGEGATFKDNVLTITKGGTYTMSGNLAGSVVITTPATDKVTLILDGVNITATKNAAIYCTQSDLLTITLENGSVNTVTDAENFTYSDATAEEPDAAIFSKTDMTFNGTGSLEVTANYNNGIGTKDDLVITEGTFKVTAINHGLRGRDSITINGGDFIINSGADGIQSNNDEDAEKGWISLEGGTYDITAGNDGIQSETTLNISAGIYALITGGGNAAKAADSTSSYKGVKSTTNMTISGGTFSIDSLDDAIHANGNIAISGGAFTISTGDDGIHADGDLTISEQSTQINVLTAYEGLESKTMTIADGTINITTTDDGINISGGNDTETNGAFGKDNFSSGNSERWLLISGGTITIKAGSDAIDINGSGKMTGGTVDLTAAMLGEGETVDVDSTWEQTGGDLKETGGNSPGGGPGGNMPGGPGGGGARAPK